jgi:hypothetical protein
MRKSFIADDQGRVVLSLWPNSLGAAGSQYHIIAGAGKYFRATITVPDTVEANLQDLISLPPYPAKDAAQTAIEAAQAYVSEAFHSKEEAGASE